MKPLLSLLLTALITCISAQDIEWAYPYQVSGWVNSLSTQETDVLVCGEFVDEFDFGPGSQTEIMDSNGLRDVFLQKLTADGDLIWAKSFGGPFNDSGVAHMANDGSVYVTGYFSYTADFDPSPSSEFVMTSTEQAIYILKLDQFGHFLWARKIGDSNLDRGYDIVTDDNGDIFVAGIFNGTIDLDPSDEVFEVEDPGNGTGGFLVKLSSEGEFLWGFGLGGESLNGGTTNSVRDIELGPDGNIFLTGSYEGDTDFDPDTTSEWIISGSSQLAYGFLLKLNSQGEFVWVKEFTGSSDIHPLKSKVDGLGNIYNVGYHEGFLDFTPDIPDDQLVTLALFGAYLVKFNSAGEHIWSKSFSDEYFNIFYAVETGLDESVYVTGTFTGEVDFRPDGEPLVCTSVQQNDPVILKFDSEGQTIWGMSLTTNSTPDNGFTCAVDSEGDVYFGGQFGGDVQVGTDIFWDAGDSSDSGYVIKFDEDAVGLEEEVGPRQILCYPVPARDILNVKLSEPFVNGQLTLRDVQGRLIVRKRINSEVLSLDIHNLKRGIYLIELRSLDGLRASRPIAVGN